MSNAVEMISQCAIHQPQYELGRCPECLADMNQLYVRCALCQIRLELGFPER